MFLYFNRSATIFDRLKSLHGNSSHIKIRVFPQKIIYRRLLVSIKPIYFNSFKNLKRKMVPKRFISCVIGSVPD